MRFTFGNAQHLRIVQRVNLVLVMSLLLQHPFDQLQFFGVEEFTVESHVTPEVAQQAPCDRFDLTSTLFA